MASGPNEMEVGVKAITTCEHCRGSWVLVGEPGFNKMTRIFREEVEGREQRLSILLESMKVM